MVLSVRLIIFILQFFGCLSEKIDADYRISFNNTKQNDKQNAQLRNETLSARTESISRSNPTKNADESDQEATTILRL